MDLLLEIKEEIARQAALEQHKRSTGASVEQINESRAASYRRIASLLYGTKSPIKPWGAIAFVRDRLADAFL